MTEPSRPMLAALFLGQVWNPTGEFPRTSSNFLERLFDVFMAADRINRARLAMAFPQVAEIVAMYKDQERRNDMCATCASARARVRPHPHPADRARRVADEPRRPRVACSP